MSCRRPAYDLFAGEVTRLQTPGALLRAATAISLHELEGADTGVVENQIDQWAATVGERLNSRSTPAALAHLHTLMFDELGFDGAREDYYNPYNSYLPLVMEMRRGIPITLSLVYCAVAWRLGLHAEGLNTPGHFLVLVTDPADGSRTCVDPFNGGRVLDLDDVALLVMQVTGEPIETDPLRATATPGLWLRRMLANLEAIFSQQKRLNDAIAMQEMTRLLNR
jgi:regulator of sirC expression with transglutaminase-like and TPR domain